MSLTAVTTDTRTAELYETVVMQSAPSIYGVSRQQLGCITDTSYQSCGVTCMPTVSHDRLKKRHLSMRLHL